MNNNCRDVGHSSATVIGPVEKRDTAMRTRVPIWEFKQTLYNRWKG